MLEKPAYDISFTDVENFCAKKIPESRWLDYKETFNINKNENRQIGKIISALANSHGGWVIFGIQEGSKDAEGRGLPGDLIGIPKTLKPAERIKQICFDAIHPPINPEIGVVSVENDKNKVVVVAHVYESDSTPHQTIDGKVYIRTSDISHLAKDGKEASVKDIELLLNRRSKSIALKNWLLERSNIRFSGNRAIPQLIFHAYLPFLMSPSSTTRLLLR